MKFDTPATHQSDRPARRSSASRSTASTARSRPRARAPYAYERHDVAPNQAYGYVVGAGIAKGRITVDGRRAGARPRPACSPIVTALDNAGKLGKGSCNTATLFGGPDDRALPPGDRAGRRRDLRAGARRRGADRRSTTTRQGGRFDLAEAQSRRRANSAEGSRRAARHARSATSTAPSPRRRSSSTRPTRRPTRAHAMMEPHATIAAWEGDKLTLWTSNQMIAWGSGDIAKTLGIPKENVRADLALHRRRLRRQAVRARRRRAGGARRARGRAAGEGGAARGR